MFAILLCFNVMPRPTVCAKDPFDVAAARAVLAKLDLRKLQSPAGAQVEAATLGELRATVPLDLRRTFDFYRRALTEQGWKKATFENAERVDKEYALLFMQRESCTLTLSVYPDYENKARSTVNVQNAGPFAPQQLPRPKGTEVFYSQGNTVMLLTTAKVPEMAEQLRELWTAAGWREYGNGGAAAETPDSFQTDFCCGPVALSLYISVAPAQGNKTSIQYSTRILQAELPWPGDVALATFSDGMDRLEATSKRAVDDLAAFYREQLAALGWQPNAALDKVAEEYANVVFSRADEADRHLLLHLAKVDEGTKIEIEPINDATLAKLTKPDEPPAEAEMPAVEPAQIVASARSLPLPPGAKQVSFDAEDEEIQYVSSLSIPDLADFYRERLVGDDWKEDRRFSVVHENAASFEFKGPREAEINFMMVNTGLGEGTVVTLSTEGLSYDAPEQPLAADEMPADEMPAEETTDTPAAPEELEPEDIDGLPIPTELSQYAQESSQFRRVITATTEAPLAKLVEFYRRHLPAAGWKEVTGQARIADDMAQLVFSKQQDSVAVSLTASGEETQIELATRSPAAAKKAGVLPKPGKARVIFANAAEADAKVDFGGSPFPIKAGIGLEKPDGPAFDVGPGNYTVKVTLKGQPVITEKITLGADETWGVLIGEQGLLPLRIY
ncbi:MAG: hypothetical protein K1X74_15085 [Pirellulales bacterium]|nr:hypothetical protein [Pirellulales bacterium]